MYVYIFMVAKTFLREDFIVATSVNPWKMYWDQLFFLFYGKAFIQFSTDYVLGSCRGLVGSVLAY